jgi:dimethylargininase
MNDFNCAVMRLTSKSLGDCSLEFQDRVDIDYELARAEQFKYANLLTQLGIKVFWIPGEDKLPDCCYVEDSAVFLDDRIVITNPGTASRRQETKAVKEFFSEGGFIVDEMGPDECLEGGDVLRIGDLLLVGNTGKTTNDRGIFWLQKYLAGTEKKVIGVDVINALHLKTACTYIGKGVLLAVKDYLPELKKWSRGLDIISIDPEQINAANALSIGDVVLLPCGFENIKRQIEAKGFRVIDVDITEHSKAEAGLTCLSVFFNNKLA